MTTEDRANLARAGSYEANRQLKQLSRESSELRERLLEQVHEWRIVAMKHSILIAEVKKNRLLADYCCPRACGARAENRGLPIQ